jgi:hypothetical protein
MLLIDHKERVLLILRSQQENILLSHISILQLFKAKKGSTRQRLDYGWSTVQSQCTIIAHWHRPIGLLVPCTIPLDLTWTQFQELVLVISNLPSARLEPLSSNHRHRVLLLDGKLLGDPIYLWKHQLYFNKIEHDKLRLWGRTVNFGLAIFSSLIQHDTACCWGYVTLPMHGVRVVVIFECHVVGQCESFCCYIDVPKY